MHKNGASTTNPLSYYYKNGAWYHGTPTNIIKPLCLNFFFLGHTIGFLPKDISVRSLHVSGKMDLINARVNGKIIELVGCWFSNAML